jgi:hypothetical protein
MTTAAWAVVLTLLLCLALLSLSLGAQELPSFHFPVSPDYAVVTLDYSGGLDGGAGTYRQDGSVAAPSAHVPFLQLFGDGSLRVAQQAGERRGVYMSRLDYSDLTDLLTFIASTGVLSSPFRTCAEAVATSRAHPPVVDLDPSEDAAAVVIELRVDAFVEGGKHEAPFTWRATCSDLGGSAWFAPDVPWLFAMQAVEKRLLELARDASRQESVVR